MKKVTFNQFKEMASAANSFGAYIQNHRILLTKEAVIDWAEEASKKGAKIDFLFGRSLGSSVIVLNSSNPSHSIVWGDQ